MSAALLGLRGVYGAVLLLAPRRALAGLARALRSTRQPRSWPGCWVPASWRRPSLSGGIPAAQLS